MYVFFQHRLNDGGVLQWPYYCLNLLLCTSPPLGWKSFQATLFQDREVAPRQDVLWHVVCPELELTDALLTFTPCKGATGLELLEPPRPGSKFDITLVLSLFFQHWKQPLCFGCDHHSARRVGVSVWSSIPIIGSFSTPDAGLPWALVGSVAFNDTDPLVPLSLTPTPWDHSDAGWATTSTGFFFFHLHTP